MRNEVRPSGTERTSDLAAISEEIASGWGASIAPFNMHNTTGGEGISENAHHEEALKETWHISRFCGRGMDDSKSGGTKGLWVSLW